MSLGSALANKKAGKEKPSLTKQLNVRVSATLYDRLEDAAVQLGTDASHLLRMILTEKLPEYEERARRAHAKE